MVDRGMPIEGIVNRDRMCAWYSKDDIDASPHETLHDELSTSHARTSGVMSTPLLQRRSGHCKMQDSGAAARMISTREYARRWFRDIRRIDVDCRVADPSSAFVQPGERLRK